MNREMRRLAEREERRKRQQQKKGTKPKPQAELEKQSLLARIVQFLREVRQELRRVAWPTRDQMVAFTTVTLITTTALTLFIFVLDFVSKRGILNLLDLR